MKILLVGMKKEDNQFTRGLNTYVGLDVEHILPTHRGTFPKCDVGIIASCQLGQTLANQAKQHFKETGTAFIFATQSFPRIKEQLDQILINKGFDVKASAPPPPEVELPSQSPAVDLKVRRATTLMGDVLKQAADRVVERAKVYNGPPTMSIKVTPPSEESFKAARSWLFAKTPVIGAKLGTFKFDGVSEDGSTLYIFTKEENAHIIDSLNKDQAAQDAILVAMRKHMGIKITHVVPRALKAQTISGVDLGELIEEWTSDGMTMDQCIEKLKTLNFVKPSGREWATNDLFQARSVFRRKMINEQAERDQKEFDEKAKAQKFKLDPLPAEASVSATEAKIEPVPATPIPMRATVLPPIPDSLKPKPPEPPPPPKIPSTPEELRVRDELISKVLAQKNFGPIKKLELIEEINAGVRTVAHQIIAERKDEKLQLTAQSIFHPDDQVVLVMDKALARDIVSAMEDIKRYAEQA